MTSPVKVYIGAQIHDGQALRDDTVLAVQANGTVRPMPAMHVPDGCPKVILDGGVILPGAVDLQVNGGGGVLFNDNPSVAVLHRISAAHGALGTDAFLPTLISDTPARTQAAIDAVAAAIAARVPGIVGLHLEGPHLSLVRKGAHDPAMIRRMEDEDLERLIKAAERVPNVMVTLAPESVTFDQMRRLSEAGVILSLGHTDADLATCHAAFDAGVVCVTHLFNAMSQLGSREPGLVGAFLEREQVAAGLIADGVHVHPATIRIALAATAASDRIFLVTDAMATAGSDIDRFRLNGRDVFRRGNRLTLADGILAGAHLDLPRAMSVMLRHCGDAADSAIRRATGRPASLLRDPCGAGRFDGTTRRAVYIRDLAAAEPVSQSLTAAGLEDAAPAPVV